MAREADTGGRADAGAPGGAGAAPETESVLARLRVAAVYVGGLLGPLGGGVVSPMLPQIGGSLHASSSAVATSLTTYFVPFAVAQLVSGTLGERWGRRRTVRVAYVVYAVGSVACAASPTLGVFLAMRAVLGIANAFTSPLLLAGLADMVDRERLSRSVGLFSACLAAGQSFAPLVGGVAAVSSWRIGFLVVAFVAVVLALAPPPGEPRPGTAAPPWRPILSARVGLISLASLVSYLGASALPFMVALYAEDQLGLNPGTTGFALLGFGVAGLLLGAAWGSLTERLGSRPCGAVAALTTACCVAAVGVAGSPAVLALVWTAAGAGASMMTVALQNLTVRAVPGNRGGVLSAVAAFRFTGAAVAPLVWLPVYHHDVVWAFVAAGLSLVVMPVALYVPAREPTAA